MPRTTKARRASPRTPPTVDDGRRRSSAKIEEISGGDKQCVGPRGDVLDTIQRRNFAVAVESDGYLYLVKASALESRWEKVGAQLRTVAESFRVPQAQQ